MNALRNLFLQFLRVEHGRTLVGTAMILLLLAVVVLTLLTALGQSSVVLP